MPLSVSKSSAPACRTGIGVPGKGITDSDPSLYAEPFQEIKQRGIVFCLR